jgi:hypothetical protein
MSCTSAIQTPLKYQKDIDMQSMDHQELAEIVLENEYKPL